MPGVIRVVPHLASWHSSSQEREAEKNEVLPTVPKSLLVEGYPCCLEFVGVVDEMGSSSRKKKEKQKDFQVDFLWHYSQSRRSQTATEKKASCGEDKGEGGQFHRHQLQI